jgi:hypothetical protein
MSDYFDDKALFTQPQVTQYSSHMVMKGVNPEIKTKYLNINTVFNNNLDDTLQCDKLSYEIDLPENINNILTCKVESVELPITFYNISSTLENNYFKVDSYNNGNYVSSTTITIAEGNYSLIELRDTINAEFTTNLAGLIQIVATEGKKMTIHEVAAQPTTVHYMIHFAIDKLGNSDKYNFKSKLGWMMGFNKPVYDTREATQNSSDQRRFIAENIYNMQHPCVVYLVLDDYLANGRQNSFQTFLNSSQNNNNIIAKIVVDKKQYSFGSVMPANHANGLLVSDNRNYNGKNNIRKMKIMLLDNYGRNVNMNGVDFSFTLKVEHQ